MGAVLENKLDKDDEEKGELELELAKGVVETPLKIGLLFELLFVLLREVPKMLFPPPFFFLILLFEFPKEKGELEEEEEKGEEEEEGEEELFPKENGLFGLATGEAPLFLLL